MKINSQLQGKYQTNDILNTPKAHEDAARIAGQSIGYTLDISGKDMDITVFGKEKLDSFEDIAIKAQAKNISLESDANAVMSNSMSEEDFAEYMKEGYSPSNMEIEDAVNNLDKIKATLLESGIVIEGYNDDLSDKELDLITGSSAVSSIIKDALKENYLPITLSNVASIYDSLSVADELSAPTDEAKKYMVKNSLEPSVDNIYKAEFSSSVNSDRKPLYYKDATGYATPYPEHSDFEELRPQIEKIIKSSDMPVDEKSLNNAKWLLDNNIPITKETLTNLENINNISFPLDKAVVAKSLATAISDGYRPGTTPLYKTESDIKKAVSIEENIEKYITGLNGSEIKGKRILEELRLHMSTEANLYLLKKGITVDTKNLENLVEQLKEAERNIYKPSLTNKDESANISDKELDDRIALFKETKAAIEDIKQSPVESTANVLFKYNSFTLNSVHTEGISLKSNYDKAERSYEALMTAPRSDMGDTIRKAFRNVDDILTDLGKQVNEINEKAVRSLGYAGIEITNENIEALSRANTAVENVISLMSPKKTLEMIRNGFNPLDMDMFDLEKELKKNTSESDNEKYSEFLVRLEKNGDISEDERASFIGFFRLFNKIEKSDGKLVGNVFGANEKLTLNNLLTASRSNRAVQLDVSIDENFGALEKLITYGESITDQILKGFKNTVDKKDEYIDEQYNDFKEALAKNEEITAALKLFDEPVTANNILAMDQIFAQRNSSFKKILGNKEENLPKNKKLSEKTSSLVDNFTSKDAADDTYNAFIDETKEYVNDQINNATSSLDLKEYQLINRQLAIYTNMAKQSSYEIPVDINGELTTLNIKLIKNPDDAGKVSITFDSDAVGKVSAEFKMKDGSSSGFIICENNKGIDYLKAREDRIKSEINNEGIRTSSIFYTNKADINISTTYLSETSKDVPTNDLYRLAKAFIKAIQ